MQMRNERILILKFLLFVTILIGLSFAGIYSYGPQILKTSDAAYIDKLDRLELISKSEENKAIFIGGSATHFGLHSRLFEEETGILSVNMGLTAGIPFQLYMESVTPYLKKGDVLFLFPEYDYYSTDYFEINESGIEFINYFDQDVLSHSQFNFFGLSRDQITVGWKSTGNLFQEIMREKLFSGGYGIYYRSNSDEYGDFVGHKDLEPKTKSKMGVLNRDGNFAEALKAKIDELEDMGVKVFLCYPPIESQYYDEFSTLIGKIETSNKENFNDNLLYNSSDTQYPIDYFFDTYYHLRWERAEEFTHFIITQYNSSLNSK